MSNDFKHLRVEESKPGTAAPKTFVGPAISRPVEDVPPGSVTGQFIGRVLSVAIPSQSNAINPQKDLDQWRTLAIKNGERLAQAEAQAKDLREAADDARGRFTKYKTRLDSANARVNELQIELTRVSAERDVLRARTARQEFLKREVHAFRQSILDGPIWNVFSELCNDVSANAGEESKP